MILAGAAAGFTASEKLKARTLFFKQLVGLVTELETQIRFSAVSVEELFSRKEDNYLSGMLCKCRENLLSGYTLEESFKEAISFVPPVCSLKAEDKEELLNFGKMLGTTDTEGQLKHLELYKNIFSERQAAAKEEYQTKSKLYKTLCISGTATFALLIL